MPHYLLHRRGRNFTKTIRYHHTSHIYFLSVMFFWWESTDMLCSNVTFGGNWQQIKRKQVLYGVWSHHIPNDINAPSVPHILSFTTIIIIIQRRWLASLWFKFQSSQFLLRCVSVSVRCTVVPEYNKGHSNVHISTWWNAQQVKGTPSRLISLVES
jgi:hypothetical protein